MRAPRLVLLLAGVRLLAPAQTTIDIGTGAPTDQIRQLFVQAYYRNGFANLTTLPPIAAIRKVGTAGLVQEFNDAKGTSGSKYALVLASTTASITDATFVEQMYPGLYSYWTSVGSGTAGMPVTDTINCGPLVAANTCQYQLFDKPYALFVYANVVNLTSSTFATRDPYYTKWVGYGGIGSMGPANSAETAVTSSSAATGTELTFDRGAIYTFTTGVLLGKTIGVKEPVWDLYLANGSHTGALGFPTGEELVMTNGDKSQAFEGGSIEYNPVTGVAFLRTRVAAITVVAPSNPVKLKQGETTTLKALLSDAAGNVLTDRDVLWSTSDSRVASATGSGSSAIVKGVGGGTATIRAISEGKTSTALTVIVTAPCCAVGEGAPTTAISQAFSDALARNHITVTLPVAASVTRSGAGYVQSYTSADGVTYVVAVSDKLLTGYLLGGRFLAVYQQMGGVTGWLGYPTSDATAGGRQMFENGALAGDPVLTVTGGLLAKWAALGYETGAAGLPAAAPAAFSTFRATRGVYQAFRGATLVSVTGGKVYAVGGLILTKYAAVGGAAGRAGAPANEEYGLNGRRRQDFEGGYIDYAPADTAALFTETARQPVVLASPASVVAGGTLRLAVGGFADGATVKVSLTGQSDFRVTVPAGAYTWDAFVPATAKSATVTVRAVDASDSTRAAQATYAVKALSDVKAQFKVVSGDTQVGAPGALLASPLVVAVTDDAGNPVPGVAVQFEASPGAKIESAPAATDANGQALAWLRLQGQQGIALATARASAQVVTFSARAAQVALTNFPAITQAVDGTMGDGQVKIAGQGALLAAVAGTLRYHQSRGELTSPNGTADPRALNDYLTSFCSGAAGGTLVCDGYLKVGGSNDPIVNLWRAGGFVGGAVDVQVLPATVNAARDAAAQTAPVLVALALTSGQTPAGGNYVVVTGIQADGTITVADPNPAYKRTTLDEYLAGFTVNGAAVKGTITGVARLLPRTPAAGGFLVALNGEVEVNSPAGACGDTLELPPASGTTSNVRLRYCAGTSASIYELDLSGAGYQGGVTDLANPGGHADLQGAGAVSVSVAKSGGVWTASPMSAAIAAGGLVNAASMTPDLAPGGIATVYGTGFGRAGSTVSVKVNGVDAKVLASFPFQINFQVPSDAASGAASLVVQSEFGSATQSFTLKDVAPALFLIGATQGAVLNSDNTVNGAGNPAKRGDVLVAFGTGFGSVTPKGNLMIAATPVTAYLGESEVPIAYAGLTPGFAGLYQVNATIPLATPPGLSLGFSIKQANIASNTVGVAVQ